MASTPRSSLHAAVASCLFIILATTITATTSVLGMGIKPAGLCTGPLKNMEYMLTLDTETMEFSVSQLPTCLKVQECYKVTAGETKDAAPRIVYDTGSSIGVLSRRLDDDDDEDGVERWVLDGFVSYEEYQDLRGNTVMMVINDDLAYLASSEMVLSLSVETWELKKLFQRSFRAFHLHSYTHGCHFYPYILSWPPSLVGNYGMFAVHQDDPSIA